jgi:vitamin B12 transporter
MKVPGVVAVVANSIGRWLPAYTPVSLGADARLHAAWRLYGRIENALDKQYEEVYTYRAVGRAAYVGVKGAF